MTITVEKITDERLLRRANSFTTSKESKMTIATAYRYGHSTIRSQIFWIELTEIPLFVASQFVRSHVGVQFFQLSKRTDRGGADFVAEVNKALSVFMYGSEDEEDEILKEMEYWPVRFDRYAPTDLAFIINAEALINMAHKRLCSKASKETRRIFAGIKDEIERCDPDLAQHLVPQCVYRNGICPEPKGCNYCLTNDGKEALTDYRKLYDLYNPDVI